MVKQFLVLILLLCIFTLCLFTTNTYASTPAWSLGTKQLVQSNHAFQADGYTIELLGYTSKNKTPNTVLLDITNNTNSSDKTSVELARNDAITYNNNSSLVIFTKSFSKHFLICTFNNVNSDDVINNTENFNISGTIITTFVNGSVAKSIDLSIEDMKNVTEKITNNNTVNTENNTVNTENNTVKTDPSIKTNPPMINTMNTGTGYILNATVNTSEHLNQTALIVKKTNTTVLLDPKLAKKANSTTAVVVDLAELNKPSLNNIANNAPNTTNNLINTTTNKLNQKDISQQVITPSKQVITPPKQELTLPPETSQIAMVVGIAVIGLVLINKRKPKTQSNFNQYPQKQYQATMFDDDWIDNIDFQQTENPDEMEDWETD